MKPITLRINFLLDSYCQECKKTKGLSSSSITEYCRENCRVGKELFELGNRLKGQKPLKKYPKLTREIYLEEKKTGLSDSKIADKYGITQPSVHRRRKKWGLIGIRGRVQIVRKESKKCKKCDCDHYAKGYCENHYRKELRACKTMSN